jgi:preprotein translocase subunit YajC
MAFRRGDRVHQEAYGAGEVVEVNASYITIAFDDGTTRKFAAARVELRRTAVPRPVRPVTAPGAKPRRAKRPVEARPGGTRS